MEVAVCRMFDPAAFPVVVDAVPDGFILLADALGQQVLNPFVIREGDVRSFVKSKPAVEFPGCRVPSMIRMFFVEGRPYSLVVEPVCGPESGHPRTQDYNFFHLLLSS